MVSKIIDNAEFYNGLLLICASGIGEDLDIPSEWPEDKNWVSTKNAIVIDFRSLNAQDDLSTQATVYSGEGDGEVLIDAQEIETPEKRLYVGDTTQGVKAITDVPNVTSSITVTYTSGNEGLEIFVKVA